jgi:hypothetical protein
MDAKRWFCLVLLTLFLADCAQPAPMPTPTPPASGASLRFRAPYGIFVDADGRMYVADRGSNRIVRMDDMNCTNWTTFA